MNVQEITLKLKASLKEILVELGYFDEAIEINIEIPKDKTNGDFSSNVAMKYARVARKAPKMIAEEIVSKVNHDTLSLQKVEIAGPGFINFYIQTSLLTNTINIINK